MVIAGIIVCLLAIGAFIASIYLPEVKKVARLIGAGALLVGAGLCVGAGGRVVDPGNVGVQVLFGAIQDDVLSEGFHIVNPFVDVNQMSVQTKTVTMAGNTALTVLSADQLPMGVDLSVLYHLSDAHAAGIRRLMPDYDNTIVLPSIRVAARDSIQEVAAVEAVSTKRDYVGKRMVELVRVRLANAMKQRGLSETSVVIDDVQLRNIRLPESIQASIAKVQVERQSAAHRMQAIKTAEQEAERARIEAEGVARVSKIDADRDAEVRIIKARSVAESNDIIAKSITPAVLQLRAIEATKALSTSSGTKTLILGGGGGGGGLPLILNMGQ